MRLKLMAAFFLILALSALRAPAWAKSKGRPLTRAEAVPSGQTVKLAFPGVKGAIPYEKYGEFLGVGTTNYKYVIKDKAGLAAAAGEGIFPNTEVNKDPRYQELFKGGQLSGSHWKFIDNNESERNFYKWASTSEDPGVKQFYTAIMFERLGMIEEAVKAFYAVAVHFPKTTSWTYYDTPWYVAPVAVDRAEQLLRRHPHVKMKLTGAKITIGSKFDSETKNDTYLVNPGQLANDPKRKEEKPADLSKAVKTVRGPGVQLKQYANRHWKLFVEGKPFPIRAITYAATPVGVSPDRGTWKVEKDWQTLDINKNGAHDGLFESYADARCDAKQLGKKPSVGDAALLRDMGVNTLRVYHHIYDKELFRRLHKEYGFYVLCGDLIGVYTVGSGAKWDVGTDYVDPAQQQTMLDSVRNMVQEYRNEPYILMWVLGNENVYGVANNAGKNPEAFFTFVNRAAALIHELDPTRPVVLANGDILFLDVFKEKCPEVDVVGMNAYRGEQGFGRHLFTDIQDLVDKPVLITEYGTSAYADAEHFTVQQAEAFQAMYLANNWEDLEAHMAGRGVGNVLGGVLFEYMDEWWKANSDLPPKVQKARAEWYASKSAIYKNLQPENHDKVPQFGFPFLDGWSYEEWYGVVSQGEGKDSPYCRVLRPAYFTMQEMWRNK